jgi:hypothetical protein
MLKRTSHITLLIAAAGLAIGCAAEPHTNANSGLDWCIAAGETYTRNSPYAQLPGESVVQARADRPAGPRPVVPWWQVRNDAYLNIGSARPSADLEAYEVDIHDHQRIHDGQIHDHYLRRTRIIRQGAIRR